MAMESTNGQPSGLLMGEYVPTMREIESGAVQVTEVAPPPTQQCVVTADLDPLDDEEAQLTFVAEHMASRNWAERFDVMHLMRKFVKFNPRCLSTHLAAIDKCLVDSMKNPRSAIIREALMLTSDLFACGALKHEIEEMFTWPKLIPALLQKSINDKKFLAVEGQHALDAFTVARPERYGVFLPDCENRNVKVAVVAMGVVKKCVEALGERLLEVAAAQGEGIEGAPLQRLVCSAVKAMLQGKRADIRGDGKICLEHVLRVCGGWEQFVANYAPHTSAGDMKQLQLVFGPPAISEPAEEGGEARGPVRDKGENVVVVEASKGDDVPAGIETSISRLRRNSTTPRSRKSEEAVVMEF